MMFSLPEGKGYSVAVNYQNNVSNCFSFKNSHGLRSLTAVNLAKAAHWLPIAKDERGALSMKDIKTLYNNELMIHRFLDVFGIKANKPKNKEKIRQLMTYGARAA